MATFFYIILCSWLFFIFVVDFYIKCDQFCTHVGSFIFVGIFRPIFDGRTTRYHARGLVSGGRGGGASKKCIRLPISYLPGGIRG